MKKRMIICGLLALVAVCALSPTDMQAMSNKKAEKMEEIVLPDDIVLVSLQDKGTVRIEKRLWEQSQMLSESHKALSELQGNKLPFNFSKTQLEIARKLMKLATEGRNINDKANLLKEMVQSNNLEQNQALFKIADFFEIANIPNAIALAMSMFAKHSYSYEDLENSNLRTLLAKEFYFKTGTVAKYFEGVSIQDLIDHGKVPVVQHEIFGLPPLYDLSSRHINSLKGLENIPGIDTVRYILLEHNQITSLEGVQFPQALQELYLKNNQIKSLEGAQFPQALQLLFLNNNQINSLAGTQFPQALQQLNLSYNQIESLEGVQFPPALQQLNLKYNRIKSLEGVQFPQALQQLNLTYNQITSLEGVQFPPALPWLDLDNNQIPPDQIEELKTDLPNTNILFR